MKDYSVLTTTLAIMIKWANRSEWKAVCSIWPLIFIHWIVHFIVLFSSELQNKMKISWFEKIEWSKSAGHFLHMTTRSLAIDSTCNSHSPWIFIDLLTFTQIQTHLEQVSITRTPLVSTAKKTKVIVQREKIEKSIFWFIFAEFFAL